MPPQFALAALINCKTRFTPQLHFLHHKLQSAMRAQSPLRTRETVGQIVDELNELEKERQLITVTSLGSTEWESFARLEGARLSSLEQRESDTPTSIPEQDVEIGKTHISDALTVVRNVDKELYGEFLEHVSEIKLFGSAVTQSFSDIRTMGAVFIRPPRKECTNLIYYYEQLIHEMSHLQLNCIFSRDRLILGDLAETAPSPLRTEPRPIFGVYHATYALAKLSHAFFRLYQHRKSDVVLQTLAQTTNELLFGIDVVKQFSLTTAGAALLKSMSDVALRVARDDIWSGFDFLAPMQHRSIDAMLIPEHFLKFRQAHAPN
jgi:HEXXH motif-containing protein